MDRASIVAEGRWTYADVVAKPVFVVATTYEFWYELAAAEDDLEIGEQPDLNEEGLVYYLSYHGMKADGSFWPDSEHFDSVAAAKAAAAARLPSPIVWSST
jgi:hypothetical protein